MCQVMNNVGRLISKDNIFSSESLSVSPESVVDDLLRKQRIMLYYDVVTYIFGFISIINQHLNYTDC